MLFTDLVGSTALRSRLGDDAADELRRVHDELLTAVVSGHGGRVVKGLGDGVMASFASAVEAVGAAVAIQEAVDAHGRRHRAQQFEVRIGISAGDVSAEADGDLFGTPVVEAARLCSSAAGGQILVADVVRVLARSRSGHRFEPVGELELKGLPEPLSALEVGWDRDGAGAGGGVRFPATLIDHGALPFAGRREPLDQLRRLWKEAAGGEFRCVLLAGAPGAGKTRLATELARDIHAEGAPVLYGRCDEHLDAPFQPLVEALRSVVHSIEGAALADLLGPSVAELQRLMPELRTHVPGLAAPEVTDPETERFRVISALASVLGHVAGEAGALILVDDLHWSDRATVQALRMLLRDQPGGLLVVGTYRDTEIDGEEPFGQAVGDLRREPVVERVLVGGLEGDAVRELLENAAGEDPVDPDQVQSLTTAIVDQTGGNAFFVGEVLRHLVEAGGVALVDGRWQLTAPLEELGIPEGVRDVVRRRVTALADGAVDVLGVAAAAGQRFDLVSVSEVAGDAEVVEQVIDGAIGAQLVAEEGLARFRFVHALVQSTLYDLLSLTRRARIHRDFAEILEQRGDTAPADLARHWERAAAVDAGALDRAIDLTVSAAEAAADAASPDTALGHYRRAIDLAAETGSRSLEWVVDTTTRLGIAERQAGDASYRERLVGVAARALEAGLADEAAAALLETDRGNTPAYLGITDHEKLDLIECTLAHGDSVALPLRARLLGLRLTEMHTLHDAQRRSTTSTEALASLEDIRDPIAEGDVLRAVVVGMSVSDQLTGREPAFERLDELCPLLPARQRVMARLALAQWSVLTGSTPERPERWLREARRIADHLEEPTLLAMVENSWFSWCVLRGELDAAEATLARFGAFARASVEPDFAMFETGNQFLLDSLRGELRPELIELAELGVAFFPEFTAWRGALAFTHLRVGNPDDAREQLDVLAADDFDANGRAYGYSATVYASALTAAELHSPHRGRLRELLLAVEGVVVLSGGICMDPPLFGVGLIDASLGDHDSAIAHFEAAVGICETIGARGFRARAQAGLARSLWERSAPGDAERARSLAVEATATAGECGISDLPDVTHLLD